MNHYTFKLLDLTNVAGSVAPQRKLCRTLANLLSSAYDWDIIGGTGKDATLVIKTPFRLPSTLEVASTVVGGTVYNDGAADMAIGMLTGIDSRFSAQLTNVDKPSVNRGDLVVATVPAAADVSDQLDEMIQVPWKGGSLVVGVANTDQEDGVYDTPFADAVAYAVVGKPVREVREAQMVQALTEAANVERTRRTGSARNIRTKG